MFQAVRVSDRSGLLPRMVDWIKLHAKPGDELAGFSRSDLSHMADDLGITEADLLRMAPNAPDNTVLMEGMMRACGLDPEGVHAHFLTLFRDIERVCTVCPNTRRCRRELAAGTASGHCHEFCPNVGTFDDLIECTMGR